MKVIFLYTNFLWNVTDHVVFFLSFFSFFFYFLMTANSFPKILINSTNPKVGLSVGLDVSYYIFFEPTICVASRVSQLELTSRGPLNITLCNRPSCKRISRAPKVCPASLTSLGPKVSPTSPTLPQNKSYSLPQNKSYYDLSHAPTTEQNVRANL